MVSAEALNRLHDYAQQGAFAPVLSVGVSDGTPLAGSQVTVTWDFNDLAVLEGQLRIEGAVWAVPAEGQRVMDVEDREFTVTLTAAGQVASVTVRPQVVVPIVEVLDVRGSRVALTHVTIRWATRLAEACDLRIQQGDAVLLSESVEANGERVVLPRRAGLLTVHLAARSVHARFGARAICNRELAVPIVAPPVRIQTSASSIEAPFGEEVRFTWTVEGADRVRLVALERDRSFILETTGEVSLLGGLLEETFIFEAEGLDGRTHRQEVRVTPAPPDLSFPSDLMNELDRPWTEELQ